MKTLEQILSYESQCLDGRDLSRLTDFVPVKDWEKLGFTLKEGIDPASIEIKPLTRDNVLEKFRSDVAFGFEKALDQRGISAGLMYEVVKMWGWVLDDEEIQAFDDYAQYGLPLFKFAAVKYGFENMIGDDEGNESKYACD